MGESELLLGAIQKRMLFTSLVVFTASVATVCRHLCWSC